MWSSTTPEVACDGPKPPDLGLQQLHQLGLSHGNRRMSAKVGSIRDSRMGSGGNLMGPCEFQAKCHAGRVAGVPAARDIGWPDRPSP